MKTKITLLVLLSFILQGCIKEIDLSQSTKNYQSEFSNRIPITIKSEQNSLISVFYENPYKNGDLITDPILIGKGPISTILNVPKDLETLYIIENEKLSIYKNLEYNQIININELHTSSRSLTDVPSKIIEEIGSKYFPEKRYCVRGDDLYKCTDLIVSKTESLKDFDYSDIWITFIGDGGFSQSNLYGNLWFYTYKSENSKNLKLEDCEIYGRFGNNIKKIDFNEVKSSKHPIFSSKTELNNNGTKHNKIYLGKFEKGLNIGFIFYESTSSVPRFTTPRLNNKIDNYILTYKDTGEKFIISGYTSGGIIRHIITDNFEGNILGMENRTPLERSYDGDYNDMICLIESNPIIKPEISIDPPIIDEYSVQEGIYLFEDNYPYQGDFDFNDVVIKYKITDFYKSSNKSKQISVELLATGASYNNTFGYLVNEEYIPFIDNLKGYLNVRNSNIIESNIKLSKTVYGEIRPYLFNGLNYILDTNYNTGDYPYVLEIPISTSDWSFRWAKEGNSLDDCYYFLKSISGGKRDGNWYITPKNESLVIKNN